MSEEEEAAEAPDANGENGEVEPEMTPDSMRFSVFRMSLNTLHFDIKTNESFNA